MQIACYKIKRRTVIVMVNKENIVFKDGIGVKGLRFKLHGNNQGNHGKHYGNHYGNYGSHHSNQGNHHCNHGNHQF